MQESLPLEQKEDNFLEIYSKIINYSSASSDFPSSVESQPLVF